MKNKYFHIHGPVFWPSVILIVTFIVVTLAVGDPMEQVFNDVRNYITEKTGWLFVLTVNAFIVFCFYLGFSKYGSIRLGGKDAEPDFSTSSWFAMLFSAGMGIGLLFWGVAEPVFHYSAPIESEGLTVAGAQEAMTLSFLHWGFHAWAIYAVVALSLAFFAFNRKMPLTLRSVFYPILGDRINGWMGDVIDILAVLATAFGLATSLGLGVSQVAAGLAYLFPIFEQTTTFEVVLLAIITLAATVSVVLGIDKGVKVLSEWNIRLAALLLVFVIIMGPTLFFLSSLIENTGNYMSDIVSLSFWTEAYDDTGWQGGWTIFYWAWWISWSPYVGMFIARISKGRTVKEFVLGVLIVPTILTFLWMSGFGGSALYLETGGIAEIAAAVEADQTTSLFVLLDQFPMAIITSFLAIVLVLSFFVTSSDSGSLVIDGLTSGGRLDSPVGQRVFWASTEGAVAAVLLIGGGLGALQAGAISTGLPFVIVLLIMCYSLQKGLSREHRDLMRMDKDKDRESYRELVQKAIQKQKKTD